MKFTLHNWGGMIVEADIDLANVVAAIKYNDHGDDFVVVKTNDGDVLKYGYFLNRDGNRGDYYDFIRKYRDEYEGEGKCYLKLPELFRGDHDSEVSNAIFFRTENFTTEEKGYWGFRDTKVYSDKRSAQLNFDWYCEDMKKFYEGTEKRIWGGYYSGSYHCDHTNDVIRYLRANDILTEENLQKIDDLKKWWRVGEIDGIAGIRRSSGDIVGDCITWAFRNGEEVKPDSIKTERLSEYTEWGEFDQFGLDLDQFILYGGHLTKKSDKPKWLDKKQRWQMAKCMQFFDDLSDILTKDGSYEVKLSANPKIRSCSKCLIPTGTKDQLTYHGKPPHSFRVAYEWNWYANLNKDCRVDYIQCETDDLPRAKKRIGEGLASKQINAVSVGYFGDDQKYHVIYGEKFDRKTKTWSWVEADPKEVLDILKGETKCPA